MAQLMPLPLTVSCFSQIQIGFTFLVPAHPGSPGQSAIKRVCVFNGLFSRATWVSRFQRGKTSLDLNEASDDGVLGMAVASAESYANNLHLSADR